MKRGLMAAALCSLCTTSYAQSAWDQETGTNVRKPRVARIPAQPSLTPIDRGRVAMAEFARCVVDRMPRPVENALQLQVGSDFSKAAAKLATPECLYSGEMRFDATLLRGALFSELWRRRTVGSKTVAGRLPTLPSIDFNVSGGNLSPDQQQHLALLWFADCVIKREPAAASAVITSSIGSAEQKQAYKSLMPHLGPCLPAGSKATLSKPIIEGVLAEALYRSSPTPWP